MRKYLIMAVTAILAVAVSAVAIGATNQAKLDVNVTPAKKGTKKKARGVAFYANVFTTTAEGTEPDPTKNAKVYIQKGFRFNTKYFKTCKAATIEANKGTDQCPAGSIVGTGTSDIVAVSADGKTKIPATATVTAVNGPKSGNKPTIHFVAKTTQPISSNVTLTGTLTKRGGTYGYLLDVPVPDIVPVPGFVVAIKTFAVTIKAKTTARVKQNGKRVKKTIHFVEAPTSCKGSWAFKDVVTYKTGQVSEGTDTVPCT